MYFVDEEKSGGRLFAKNFGEQTAETYGGRGFMKRFVKSEDESFIGWIGDILCKSGEKNAVVFPLSLFCTLGTRHENIADILNPDKCTGSIVLIVPPTKESVISLTKTYTIFDALNARYITEARNEKTADYCNFLRAKSKNGGACLFLHTYTKKRITTLLYHVVLEHFDRFVSEEVIGAMGEYLAYYMNNRFLQLEEKLFDSDFDLRLPMYDELYRRLCGKDVWDRLLSKVSAITAGEKSVAEYVREIGKKYSAEPSNDIFISVNHDSVEYRLMGLSPYDVNSGNDSPAERARHRKELNILWRNSHRIGNREPNGAIYEKMREYLDRLDFRATQYNDRLTCRRIVTALSILSERMYDTDLSGDTLTELTNYLDYCIMCAENLLTASENYRRMADSADGKMNALFVKKAENDYLTAKREFETTEESLPYLTAKETDKNGAGADVKKPVPIIANECKTERTAKADTEQCEVTRKPFARPNFIKQTTEKQ